MKLSFFAALPFVFIAHGALAQDYQAALTAYFEETLRPLTTAPELVAAAKAANTSRSGIDQAAIDGLDTSWRNELGGGETPTISPILKNPAADFLRAQVDASDGRIIEAFITDAVGLNVAVSSPTSDMWQGDEDKFTKVYPAGPDAVLIGDVELDESTQSFQAQISVPLVEPSSNTVVGTLTIGVNADAL